MNLLLDTHVFLWSILDDTRLSSKVRDEIESGADRVLVSSASFWEIAIKFSLGKLPLPAEPERYLPNQRVAAGFELLVVGEHEACGVHRLPHHHRDPFDRMLIAQARRYDMVIATADPLFEKYDVRTTW